MNCLILKSISDLSKVLVRFFQCCESKLPQQLLTEGKDSAVSLDADTGTHDVCRF